MSEPKTIRELLAAAQEGMVASHKKAVVHEPESQPLEEGFSLGVAYAADKFKPILDYHIIPGANAVVTPQGLEDAVKAIADSLGIAWTPENHVEQDTLRREARVALEAAGIEVVDEVVEGAYDTYKWTPDSDGFFYRIFQTDQRTKQPTGTPEKPSCGPACTIYIKRATTVSHSKEE